MSWNNIIPIEALLLPKDVADLEQAQIDDYLRRNPTPAFKTDPPIKTRLEDQIKYEEDDVADDQTDEV